MKGTAKPLPPPKSRSKKSKPREEIEVVFGLKQALIILVAIVVMFGGAFLWGVETGHTRAGEGKASLLAFLESKAAPAPGPVDIPDVLLSARASRERRLRNPGASAQTRRPRNRPNPPATGSRRDRSGNARSPPPGSS